MYDCPRIITSEICPHRKCTSRTVFHNLFQTLGSIYLFTNTENLLGTNVAKLASENLTTEYWIKITKKDQDFEEAKWSQEPFSFVLQCQTRERVLQCHTRD